MQKVLTFIQLDFEKFFVYTNGELVLNAQQSCIDQVLFLRNYSTTQYKLLMGVSVDTIQGFCVATFGSSGLLRLFRR